MRNSPAGVYSAGFMRQAGGGLEVVKTNSTSGSAATVDLRLGNVHDVTLTANCTLTVQGAMKGFACSVTLILRQDGTGSRTVTWPGSVTWLSGSAPYLYPSASAVSEVILTTTDGGTSWLGAQAAPIGPGYEFGYDQATGAVSVASTTEASGTTLISCAAHVFDGSPVVATFYCPNVNIGSQTSNIIVVSLFESSTQIGRLSQWQTTSAGGGNAGWPGDGLLRFTPSAGSHTYTVSTFATSTAATAPAFNPGGSGTGTRVPMFIRFAKA